MHSLIRQEVIQTARTVVIKIGSSVLANEDDSLNVSRIASIAEQVYHIRQSGRQVIVVSSGAVGAGIGLLGLGERPAGLPHLQAAAAAGQAHLIRLYNDCLEAHGYLAAQVLLTANDFRHRERYLNVRNTLNTLLEYPVIPIVNENDTVSISGIQFGDNDALAGMVNNLFDSSLLIILSVIDGLMDGAPDDADSNVISLVERFDDNLLELARSTRSRRGTGGMRTKLAAVRRVIEVGENVIIANGCTPGVLDQIMEAQEVGTLFLAHDRNVPAWKRWIGYTIEPAGRIHVDAGARRALTEQGCSLLSIGITHVDGVFNKGELVSVVDAQGQEFARGLTNYSNGQTAHLAGRRIATLGEDADRFPYDEVIHRDNLAVIR